MDYKAFYTRQAQQDLDKIEGDKATKIIKKIDFYLNSKTPLKFSKKLTGFETDTYRFRVGDFRIIFRIDSTTKNIIILIILKIAQRKDIYKNL